jgi:hypothetical protein
LWPDGSAQSQPLISVCYMRSTSLIGGWVAEISDKLEKNDRR